MNESTTPTGKFYLKHVPMLSCVYAIGCTEENVEFKADPKKFVSERYGLSGNQAAVCTDPLLGTSDFPAALPAVEKELSNELKTIQDGKLDSSNSLATLYEAYKNDEALEVQAIEPVVNLVLNKVFGGGAAAW